MVKVPQTTERVEAKPPDPATPGIRRDRTRFQRILMQLLPSLVSPGALSRSSLPEAAAPVLRVDQGSPASPEGGSPQSNGHGEPGPGGGGRGSPGQERHRQPEDPRPPEPGTRRRVVIR